MVFKLERIERIREYEIIYIMKPDLTDEEQKNLVTKIEEVIAENKGQLLKTTVMGKRKLFHETKGHLRGSFVHSVFLGNNELVPELERKLRIDENVIRYQTIKLVEFVSDIEARKEYYNSSKFEELATTIAKPIKEVKDEYDKFKPRGV
jgi:small subunit ribosomal protein S6